METALDLNAYKKRQHIAFALARRHSKFVVFMRAAIPAVCVIFSIGAILFHFFDPFRVNTPVVSISTIGISGSKITMQLPKLSGYKKDLRSYNVTAQTATQDVKQQTLIELVKPNATIELEKNQFARVQAATGTYDTKNETMVLNGGVEVKTDTGYDIQMLDARANMKAGSIETSQPVKVKMENGTIEADTMNVLDSGKNILFNGHVVTFFNSIDTDSAKQNNLIPEPEKTVP
jgi:lipopolysaccharide export system protein LptC